MFLSFWLSTTLCPFSIIVFTNLISSYLPIMFAFFLISSTDFLLMVLPGFIFISALPAEIGPATTVFWTSFSIVAYAFSTCFTPNSMEGYLPDLLYNSYYVLRIFSSRQSMSFNYFKSMLWFFYNNLSHITFETGSFFFVACEFKLTIAFLKAASFLISLTWWFPMTLVCLCSLMSFWRVAFEIPRVSLQRSFFSSSLNLAWSFAKVSTCCVFRTCKVENFWFLTLCCESLLRLTLRWCLIFCYLET